MNPKKDVSVLRFFQIEIRLLMRFLNLLEDELLVFKVIFQRESFIEDNEDADPLNDLVLLLELENIFLRNLKRLDKIRGMYSWELSQIPLDTQIEYKDLFAEVMDKKNKLQVKWEKAKNLLKKDYLRAHVKSQVSSLGLDKHKLNR